MPGYVPIQRPFKRAYVAKAKYGRRAAAKKETGFVDVANASYAMDTTGTIALLNTVPQGASVNERVGKKLVLKSLQCRGAVYAGSTGTQAEGALMIVYDKRPAGALPAITDILTAATSHAMNNDANAGRFKILKRMDYDIQGMTAANFTEKSLQDSTWFLKLRDLPTTYKAAATGAIGDIEEGALYIVSVGSVVAGTTAGSLAATFRVRFLDV